MKIQKKKFFFLGGGSGKGGSGWWGGGGQSGCERRITVFGKIQNKNIRGVRGGRVGGGGVRVDVNK